MNYLLVLPKQSGGQQVINDRRAALIVLPDGTTEENALETAREIAAAADSRNSYTWYNATGGFVSAESLGGLPGGLAWLNTCEDTPEVLKGGPDDGPNVLLPTQVVLNNGDTAELYLGTDASSPGVVTALVQDSQLVRVSLDGTVGALKNGQAAALNLNGNNLSLTPTVSNGAITALQTPATSAVVQNGASFPVDGGTVTLTVANREVTATFTPEP